MPNITTKTSPNAGYYIAGFVDGEGSFYSSVRKRTDSPCGWKFSLSFNIANNDKQVLLYCQKHLKCGSIREILRSRGLRAGKTPPKDGSDNSGITYLYEVSDLRMLREYIVSFFETFQFVSVKKRHEFGVFKKLLTLLEESPIRTRSRLEVFCKAREELGRYRKNRFVTNEEILKTFICAGGVPPLEPPSVSRADKTSFFKKKSSETTRSTNKDGEHQSQDLQEAASDLISSIF